MVMKKGDSSVILSNCNEIFTSFFLSNFYVEWLYG